MDIANCIVNLSKSTRQPSDEKVVCKLNTINIRPQAPLQFSKSFSLYGKGKEGGHGSTSWVGRRMDYIFPELLNHASTKVKHWLLIAILTSGDMLKAFKIFI